MTDDSAAVRSGVTGLILPGLATAVGISILCGLGAWQLQRLGEKEALIARVSAGLNSAPIPAPGPKDWSPSDIADLDYRPLTVAGHFLNDREVHVYGVLERPKGPAGGTGYFILTPLMTAQGWLVIVNRGFVPIDKKDPASRAAGQIAGETTVSGIARRPDGGNIFTPKPDLAHNMWFSRDPIAIAAALGLPAGSVAPYTIDAAFDPTLPGGIPQGGETVVSFPNNHLQYALTWFGLAAALAGVFVTAAFRWLREGKGSLRREA